METIVFLYYEGFLLVLLDLFGLYSEKHTEREPVGKSRCWVPQEIDIPPTSSYLKLFFSFFKS